MREFKIALLEKSASSEIAREKFELNKIGITEWLVSKNIISPTEEILGYEDVMRWTRTGGETYCTSFNFVTERCIKTIFIKAIVTTSPEKSLEDWLRRRKILADNNIPVSNWYHADKAVIIEDFYSNTFSAVSFHKLIQIAFTLDKLGFTTLKFVDDIRADEQGNPFYIDFGFDLGEPSPKQVFEAKECLLRIFPHKQQEIVAFYEGKRM